MFEDPGFIQWANENIVFLVGYKGKAHGDAAPPAEGEGDKGDAEKKDRKDEKKGKAPAKDGECSLYPGLTCDDHERIHDEAIGGKGGPKLECPGYPYSYMVAPDGTTFERHGKDRAVADLEAGVADFVKKAKVKPSKKYQGHLASLEAGDKAAEAGKWKDALAAYAKVDAVAKKMPSLAAGVAMRVDKLDALVSEAFQKQRDDEALDLAAKVKAIKALRAQVGAKLTTGCLPVVAEMDAWIKENPPPAPTPPAK